MHEYIKDVLLQLLEELKNMLAHMSGAPTFELRLNKQVTPDSPFTRAIPNVNLPPRCTLPSMKEYDGMTYLEKNFIMFQSKMQYISIPVADREANICKGFGSTLCKPVLQWFVS